MTVKEFEAAELSALLRDEAADAPDQSELLADVRRRLAEPQRRSGQGWLAVAAAVALIAGGIVTAVTMSKHSNDAATPADQQLQIPPGSALVPYQTADLTVPVSAPVPAGWTGRLWISVGDAFTIVDVPGQHSGQLQRYQSRSYTTGTTAPAVLSEASATLTPVTVSGHPATLARSAGETLDSLGIPNQVQVIWQRSDGQWISVSANDGDRSLPTDQLLAYAATVTDTPQVLHPAVRPRVTLPGRDELSVFQPSIIDPNSPALSYLCRPGRSPLAQSRPSQGMDDCLTVSLSTGTASFDSATPMTTTQTTVGTVPVTIHLANGAVAATRLIGDVRLLVAGAGLTPSDAALLAGTTVVDASGITVAPGTAAGGPPMAEPVASPNPRQQTDPQVSSGDTPAGSPSGGAP